MGVPKITPPVIGLLFGCFGNNGPGLPAGLIIYQGHLFPLKGHLCLSPRNHCFIQDTRLCPHPFAKLGCWPVVALPTASHAMKACGYSLTDTSCCLAHRLMKKEAECQLPTDMHDGHVVGPRNTQSSWDEHHGRLSGV